MLSSLAKAPCPAALGETQCLAVDFATVRCTPVCSATGTIFSRYNQCCQLAQVNS